MSVLTYYFDIAKNGKDVYGNKDIGILINEQAVVESVMNILLTEPGQKIMDPEFGIPLYKYLFEPIDQQTSVLIQSDIEYALTKFEQRIKNVQVFVTGIEDENSYSIEVFFEILMTAKQQNLKIQLDKIR